MITDQVGQVLYDTPNMRLLWSVSLKHGNRWLQSVELNAKANGTVTDRVFGTSNGQVDGRLRLLADRSSLNNPESSDTSIGKVGKDNHMVRLVAGKPLFLTTAIILILLPWSD